MKGTKITLGEREYVLRYDLNAIAEIGERLDIRVRLAHIQEDLLEVPLPLGAIRTVIWAGLIHKHPDMTEKQVGGLIDTDDLPEVMTNFFEHFGMTSPDEDVSSMLATIGAMDSPEPEVEVEVN